MLPLRSLTAVILLIATSACTVTRQVAPAQYVPTMQPSRMLVVDQAGFMYALDKPAIVEDRLVGLRVGSSDTISMNVSRVQYASVQTKSPVRTAILASAFAAATAVMITYGRGGKGLSCKLIYDNVDVIGKNQDCDTSDR
jgi:hypothetical protein